MTDSTLIKILEEKSMSFTEEELRMIIDEELEKSEEEMDTDLIERCLAALNGENADIANTVNKRRGIKLSRVLLIAAVIILAFIIAIPVCARFLNIDAADNIVKFRNDHFEVDLSDESENASVNIVDSLRKNGVENVYLPSALFDDESMTDSFVVGKGDYTKDISFTYSKDNYEYRATICSYSGSDDMSKGQLLAPNEYENVKQLDIDNLNVIVFNKGEDSYIYYISNCYEYSLSLINCGLDKAIEVANTIKGL